MPIANRTEALAGAYSDLASEYYDPARHPTCANFREASDHLVRPWLRSLINPCARVVEIGAGDSVVLDWLTHTGQVVSRLVITDLSPQMLQHSHNSKIKAEFVICDAGQLPMRSQSFDLAVCSLGDAYNTVRSWREAGRVLRKGGHVVFTTPSFEWAWQFRNGSNVAEFVTANETVLVPSYVVSTNAQRQIIEENGLSVIEIRSARDTQLRSFVRSPKLRSGNIVTAYLAEKKYSSK